VLPPSDAADTGLEAYTETRSKRSRDTTRNPQLSRRFRFPNKSELDVRFDSASDTLPKSHHRGEGLEWTLKASSFPYVELPL
jgi:hypothetical protein